MKKYYSILKEKGCDEAQKYKNSLVPSTLYKYIPLLDERFSKYDEENKKSYVHYVKIKYGCVIIKNSMIHLNIRCCM